MLCFEEFVESIADSDGRLTWEQSCKLAAHHNLLEELTDTMPSGMIPATTLLRWLGY
jgi:hypothetical protein